MPRAQTGALLPDAPHQPDPRRRAVALGRAILARSGHAAARRRPTEGDAIDHSILALLVRHGLPLVALMIFAGELGMPTGVPMEVALLLVGGYAVHSLPALVAGLGLVTAADVAGTTLLYLAVRTGGRRLLARLLRHHGGAGAAPLARWRRRARGHDAAAIFLSRSLPLVRMYVPIGAGLLALPTRTFLLGATPAALVWAGTPLVLGYLLRGDVRRVAVAYTRVSSALLLLLPGAGLLALGVWWVRQGRSAWARLRRGRVALGLAAGLAGAAYLAKLAWANERLADRGHAALPSPILALWLALIAGCALALLGLAVADVRALRRAGTERTAERRRLAAELAGILAWVGLVGTVGVAVLWLELRYPAL